MLSRKPGTLQKLKLHFYHGICACFGAGGAEKNKGVRSFTPKIKNPEKNTCSPKNTADQNLLVLKILRKEKKPMGTVDSSAPTCSPAILFGGKRSLKSIMPGVFLQGAGLNYAGCWMKRMHPRISTGVVRWKSPGEKKKLSGTYECRE